jgi:GntR family transcriptional regulator of arabinose operon
MKNELLPKYYVIKEKLKKQILDGEYAPGDLLPSQNELMKSEQASYSTISRVLTELKNENLIYRVGGKGTYVQKRAVFVKEKMKIWIALLEQDDSDSTEKDNLGFPHVELMHSIIAYCASIGMQVKPVYHDDNDFINQEVYDSNSGIIFLASSGKQHLFERLNSLNVPYAAHAPMDCIYGNYNAVTVNVNHGAYLATKALIDAGHRNIAFFHTPSENDFWALPKFDGYKKALREADIEFREELLLRSKCVTQDCTKEAEHFFSRNGSAEKVTALFAINDTRALAAMKVMTGLGIKIPDDIAVVGYDDLPQSRNCQIPLTTVKLPCEEMGKATVKLLLLLAQKPEFAPLIKVMKSEMIYRESFPDPGV